MAVTSCQEEKIYFEEVVNKYESQDLDSSCLQIVTSDSNALNQSYCLDVLPIVLESSSFPMMIKYPYHNSHASSVYFSVVSDEGNTNPDYPRQLPFLSLLQAPQPTEKPMSLVTLQDSKNSSTPQYSTCSMNIDIEKETFETHKTDEGTLGSLTKSEDALTAAFCWRISRQIGGKISQLLRNHILELLRCTSRGNSTTEKTPETLNNRLGKFKRSATFNSRKVACLFSILSSIGTIVLIYLTLRVKQMNDALVYMQ